jgi:hypothetical protein
MQYVYFTVTAVFLYLVSDMILTRIEKLRGKPLPNRSLIFFGIILVLAILSFQAIEMLMS